MEIYLDNSATTRVSDAAAAKMLSVMTEGYGNPSSLHRRGFLAEQELNAARGIMAEILGVRPDEIFFPSCGSEANNLALLGAARAAAKSGRKIITTAIEHASVLSAAAELEKEGFTVVRVFPGPDGSVSAESIAAEVDGSTTLVSVMQVNSETGAVQDIAAIARAVKRKNPRTLVHTDCVQSFCRLPVQPMKWNIDLLSASAHKIHGPKGTALFWRKKGVRVLPLYYGSAQEGGFHPGTENTPGICGFGTAAQEMWKNRSANWEHFLTLRQRLEQQLARNPEVVFNSPANGVPYILNLSVPGIRSEIMIHFLEQFEIYVSSGSACSRGAKSHVLTAMGLSPERIDSAVRVSLCRYNTIEEMDEFCRRLEQGCRQIHRAK